MSGGGKGGKGGKRGKGVKRHRTRQLKKLHSISKPAARRLCRRAGIKRISGDVHETLEQEADAFMGNIFIAARFLLEYNRQKTVQASHIVQAYRKVSGKSLYGF